MLPALIGSAISGGLGAISGLINNYSSYNAQQSANNANMELAKYSYSQNLEQWNRQNEYNTPSAQMQRYADAGLNPNLIYGQGSNGNAGSSPQFSPPTVQPASMRTVDFGQVVGNMINQYNNLRMQNNQIDLQDMQKQKIAEEINVLKSQSSYNAVRSELGNSQILLNGQRYSFNRSYNPLALSMVSASIDNKKAQTNTFLANAEKIAVEQQYTKAMIESVKANTDLKNWEKKFLIQSFGTRLAIQQANLGYIIAQTGLSNANAVLSQARTSESFANQRLTNRKVIGQSYDNILKGKEVKFLQDAGFLCLKTLPRLHCILLI